MFGEKKAIWQDDGAIEFDNWAAERAAAIYSLIGTAKLNGVDPEAWLRQVLTHVADHPVNWVGEFLPWHFAAQIPTA